MAKDKIDNAKAFDFHPASTELEAGEGHSLLADRHASLSRHALSRDACRSQEQYRPQKENALRKPISLIGFTLILPLRFYRYFISPMLGTRCRFEPSCSQYAIEAIKIHGCLKGCYYSARRLVRCHPWHPGGVDPVP